MTVRLPESAARRATRQRAHARLRRRGRPAPANDFVFHIQMEGAVSNQDIDEVGHVPGIHLLACAGTPAGTFTGPESSRRCAARLLRRRRRRSCRPRSAARSTMTVPGRSPAIISAVINNGAFLPGTAAVVIIRSTPARCRPKASAACGRTLATERRRSLPALPFFRCRCPTRRISLPGFQPVP